MSGFLDVLGAPGWGRIDDRGCIQPGHGKWCLGWWIRSAKGWHQASREPFLLQVAPGVGAVVETRMKLPDGYALQRAWAVAAGGGPAVAVVEVTNEAATAFAAALVLEAPSGALIVDKSGVSLDRMKVLAWDRAPAVVAAGSDDVEALLADDGQSAASVAVPVETGTLRANQDQSGASVASASRGGRGKEIVAAVWPLPHTAKLAASVLLGAGPLPSPSDLPEADAVERGWQVHLDRGARIEVPDQGLARRIQNDRRRWLGHTGRMEASGVGELSDLAVSLDHHGYHEDAELVLDEIAERWTTEAPVKRLMAFSVHHDLTGNVVVAARHLEAVVEAVEAAARAGVAVPVQAVLRLLVSAGQNRAADDLRCLGLREAGTPTGGLRAELVDDHGNGMVLAPGFRRAWLGGSLAVYDLPTRFGPVSYAVRWHGDRPALLWELSTRSGMGPVKVCAPALDQHWQTAEPSGEALLAIPG